MVDRGPGRKIEFEGLLCFGRAEWKADGGKQWRWQRWA